MILSLNYKDAGDQVCIHTMTGETEEEFLVNAKKHGMEVHGYTKENWNGEISKSKATLETNKENIEPLTSNYNYTTR